MAADENDENAEDNAFDQSHGHIAAAGEIKHVVEVVDLGNPEDLRGDEVCGDDTDGDALHGEQRHGDEHGDEARDHKVVDRVNAEGAQGVDLLGDLHCAELGRHGCADTSGDHESAEHRAQFAEHGDADHRADRGVHLQAVELEEGLRGEHRTGEGAGDEDNELRAVADFVDLLNDQTHADLSVKNPAQGFRGEEGEIAEIPGEGNQPVTCGAGGRHARFCAGLEPNDLRRSLGLGDRVGLADEPRFQVQLAENAPDFFQGNGWVIGLEKDDVVERVNFVTEAGDGAQLQIQAQQLVRRAKAAGVDFNFYHASSFGVPWRVGQESICRGKPRIAPEGPAN